MKKILGLTLAAMLVLVFAGCDDSIDNNNTSLPNLTIINQSSYVLTDVQFFGLTFAAQGTNELPINSTVSRALTAENANAVGYITFIRKDIGITLRTQLSVSDLSIPGQNELAPFTINDNTLVDEVGNLSNRRQLGQISFLSQVTVEYGGLNVAKNQTVNLGESVINNSRQIGFTLRNTGVGKLLLSGTEPVKISGDTESVFSVLQPTSSEVAPNGSLPFRINFIPRNEQSYTATVTISSNDQSGDFAFTITAAGVTPKPIAVVNFEEAEIPQNGTINAGEVLITQAKNITVAIRNTGDAVLTLDTADINISGADAAAFTRQTSPGSNISAGSQSTFIIEFRPVKQGEHNAILSIPTNDNSRNPIMVFLRGAGIQGSGILELSQNGTVITNNSMTPFDFGQVLLESNISLTFTIKNTGNVSLELTGTPVIESSNTVFTILNQPTTRTISPGASISFVVRYTPIEERQDTGYINILNNSTAVDFIMNVSGTGYIQRPQISIQQDGITINQWGEFDFGSVQVGEQQDITFTIGNTGEAPLTFVTVDGNRITILDDTGEGFTVVQQPSAVMQVAPGNTTNFVMRFSPTTPNYNYIAHVQIETNSKDNAVFEFWIKGFGMPVYEIGDMGPAGGFVFYDKGVFTDGWRYLEAAPPETEFSSIWGPSTSVANTGVAVGTGRQNTQLIVNALSGASAARLCAEMTFNGFSDWFLPSRDELDVMYQRLRLNGDPGGFGYNTYWSSSQSQYYASGALTLYFGDGSPGSYNNNKHIAYTVRAVRAF